MTNDRPALLLATSNPGKRAEFARLLAPGIHLVTMADVGITLPPEDGTSFAEIAATKALAGADQSRLLTLADDSGLEIDALGGAPGIHSARYAGEPPAAQRNITKVLEAMRHIEPARRTARFRCAVALARPGTIVATAEGTCRGHIAAAPSGSLGFGYDPIFLLDDGRTMAEVPVEEKNRLSHRAQAYRAITAAVHRALQIPAN